MIWIKWLKQKNCTLGIQSDLGKVSDKIPSDEYRYRYSCDENLFLKIDEGIRNFNPYDFSFESIK